MFNFFKFFNSNVQEKNAHEKKKVAVSYIGEEIKKKEINQINIIDVNYYENINIDDYFYKDLDECIRYHGKPIRVYNKGEAFEILSGEEYKFVIENNFDRRYEFNYLIAYLDGCILLGVFPKN